MRRPRRENRRQVVKDVLLWVLLSIAVSAIGPDPLDDPAAFAWVTVPRVALAGLAVFVGREWPLAAVALLLPLGPWDFSEGLATSDLTWLSPPAAEVKIFPFPVTTPFVIWYAYLSGRRSRKLWPVLVLACLTSLIGVRLVLSEGGTVALWTTMITGLVGTYAVPYLLGVLRRRLLLQREQARHSAEAQARLRERARIARDMHDSLGHDLALIAVRAAGLELAPTLEPAQVKAAGELREAAADATERLRQIIGVLRDDADAAPLLPVHEDVTALVDRARASGMTIVVNLAGPVPGLAHAVVQEGLTNAAKHAPGAEVAVTVSPHRVAVANGPAARSRPVALTGGLGLAGLKERVRLEGGTLRAGPVADGFELAVDLP
ncbi:sensor histidine kinase [Nonomuraea sp. LPB2021202275-12-8]|uniref:sensor histidine kinase n=1 Tax=Nonomuraea sp. LPB2021202275-12-8 TaxID=3120159 RepID=UPI00300C00BB